MSYSLTTAEMPGLRIVHGSRQSVPDGSRFYHFAVELHGKLYGLSGEEVGFRRGQGASEPLPDTDIYPLEVIGISTSSTVLRGPGERFPTTSANNDDEYDSLVDAAVAIFLGLNPGPKNVILRISFSSLERVEQKTYDRRSSPWAN